MILPVIRNDEMKITLSPSVQGQDCTIEYFIHHDGEPHGMIIVFPGGAYYNLADHEKEPVARAFYDLGFNTAVCCYRVNPVHYPQQLYDGCDAVKYTRQHARELNTKPDNIAVLGFSAGGHLAAMVSNIPTSPEARPDATILGYAALSNRESLAAKSTFYHLFGNQLPLEAYKDFSWPDVVHKNTPPAFLWHTMTDEIVPVGNSIEYALALKKLNIDVELHIYPQGPHGLSVNNRPDFDGQFPEISSWTELCAEFLKKRHW